MRDSADPVLAGQPFPVRVGAALAAAVVTSEYKINYLRPAIGGTLIARLGEGS
ncbi:hypothetical protein [Cupriavidus basilensis]|uniref:hypothetical protein n=1 Tax=Cupriavidus basilensis TaxID=68895 RepID=UPI0039F6BCC5